MKLRGRPALGLVLAAALLGCGLFGPKPAWLLTPPPIYDGPVVEAGKLHRATLENGLHVIVLENHRLPRVALGVAVRRGAASDPIDRAGLATFTAEVDRHVRDLRASPRLPGFDAIRLPGDRRGQCHAERTRDGVPLAPALLDQLDRLAQELGLEPLRSRK